ncbi:MAG: nucleotidyltransferase [Mollicutes bacterium]|nr:nucleotidyltransferase [Mollicutes bacterium]
MNKIIGIIAEYNPFHNGHLYQIKKIREKYKDATIVVVSSSSFTQRGEISLLNKFDKTKVALNNGVDLVIELPYVYSTQSSDIFASAAIKILNYLKINTLCFGTERDNIDDIKICAQTQLNNPEYDILVKKYLNDGFNYPTALNKALKSLVDIEITEPNELLALSYIKEIISNKLNIDIFNIKRTNDYHDIESNESIVSASNIRNKLINNIDIKDKVPSDVYDILKNIKFNNKYFEFLKYKINSESDLEKYLDVDEGLSTRIRNAINESNNLEELIQNIKTKRYTYNKISRMLNHILCSFTKDERDDVKNIEYIRILGFNDTGQRHLNNIKNDLSINILNKYDTSYRALEIEKRVSLIYSMIINDIMDAEIKNKPIKK